MEYKEMYLITQLFACYGMVILCITKIMPVADLGSLATVFILILSVSNVLRRTTLICREPLERCYSVQGVLY